MLGAVIGRMQTLQQPQAFGKRREPVANFSMLCLVRKIVGFRAEATVYRVYNIVAPAGPWSGAMSNVRYLCRKNCKLSCSVGVLVRALRTA